MTLGSAVQEIQQRVGVDLAVGFNISDAVQVTDRLMEAARTVSRDTLCLSTLHSALTLTACTTGADAGAEIDLLSEGVSEKAIFICDGIHINGSWLTMIQQRDLVRDCPSYYSDTANAHPQYYAPLSPSSVRLHRAPDATAASASDNFAVGFYLHDTYQWPVNEGTELLGPREFHDLIILRCYLDITEGYVTGQDALIRRAAMSKRYDTETAKFRDVNENRSSKIKRRDGAGRSAVYFDLGGQW